MKRKARQITLLCLVFAGCHVEAVLVDGGNATLDSLDGGTPILDLPVASDTTKDADTTATGDIPDILTDVLADIPDHTSDIPDQGSDVSQNDTGDQGTPAADTNDASDADLQNDNASPPDEGGSVGDVNGVSDLGADVAESTAWNPCESDEDCIEGPCLPSVSGKFCSVPCEVGCQEGYACKPLLDMDDPPNCLTDSDCPQGYECEIADYAAHEFFECDLEACGGDILGTCFCDDDCLEYGDCCKNYCETCGQDVEGCRECVVAGGEEAEPPTYCVDTNVHLCKPCSTDTDCSTFGGGDLDHCTTIPDDFDPFNTRSSYCLRDCGSKNGETPVPIDAICKNGTECQAVSYDDLGSPIYRCIPPTGVCPCSEWAAESQASTTCEQGPCEGTRTCHSPGESTCEVCPAGGACSTGECDGEAGCVFSAITGPCDDGDNCTTGDQCEGGECLGGTPNNCDDGNACTNDSCDSVLGCLYTPSEGNPCDDGDPCTSLDTCEAQGCVGSIFSDGTALEHIQIEEGQNGFNALLNNGDRFGSSCFNLGDVDGDGNLEILVGAPYHDSPGLTDAGGVWVLKINSSGHVVHHNLIADEESGFVAPENPPKTVLEDDLFGSSITSLGDFGTNGTIDIVVGAPGDDFGNGSDVGAIWILEMDSSGSGQVLSHIRIGDESHGFGNNLITGGDHFGASVAAIGDLDGNGYNDLAIGVPGDDPFGAIWLFMMTASEETGKPYVSSFSKYAPEPSPSYQSFGSSLAYLGDINGDGNVELAVGAPQQLEGDIFILSINGEASVTNQVRIGKDDAGFAGSISGADRFGESLSSVGDINGDGVPDLAVGAINDDGPSNDSTNVGAVWLLFLNNDGTVSGHHKISKNEGGFTGSLSSHSNFGTCATPLGDLNQDGFLDVMVGAGKGGNVSKGEIWSLFLGNESCSETPTSP